MELRINRRPQDEKASFSEIETPHVSDYKVNFPEIQHLHEIHKDLLKASEVLATSLEVARRFKDTCTQLQDALSTPKWSHPIDQKFFDKLDTYSSTLYLLTKNVNMLLKRAERVSSLVRKRLADLLGEYC